MARIDTLDALRALYGSPSGRARDKVLARLDAHCRHFIALSPFVLIATSDAHGAADVSPRGDMPGFVVTEETRLLIPDRPGNNRIDSLSNIIANAHAGLLFLIPGVNETLRVNGRAAIHDDEALLARFAVAGRPPRTVITVEVEQAFLHCAKAFMRSDLWSPLAQLPRTALPTMGEMLADQVGHCDPVETQDQMEQRYRATLY
ncbi:MULTISPECIES: pyridoxamine 5'-phosphate oxidase family protein [unclassified Xanthobacter]|uniref:pyridoxamine 5'-phosphate oxidase family protein n=1 Tax=unclassified Xanthobacter TaxID=2623496 RepID=UPI001F45FD5A|nr:MULTISPECIES: pyridoxamine 5'-phosphate oxidase family protein [unclassified Xanthobacter]